LTELHSIGVLQPVWAMADDSHPEAQPCPWGIHWLHRAALWSFLQRVSASKYQTFCQSAKRNVHKSPVMNQIRLT